MNEGDEDMPTETKSGQSLYEKLLSIMLTWAFIIITALAVLYWVTRQCNVDGRFIAGPMVYECKLKGYR
jgi:uncharacterized membrane protein